MIYRVVGPSRSGKTKYLRKKASDGGFFVPFPPDEIFITSSVKEELKFEGIKMNELPWFEDPEIPPIMLPHTLKELLAIAVAVKFCERKNCKVLSIDEPFILFSEDEEDQEIVKKMCKLMEEFSKNGDLYYSHRQHLKDPAHEFLSGALDIKLDKTEKGK